MKPGAAGTALVTTDFTKLVMQLAINSDYNDVVANLLTDGADEPEEMILQLMEKYKQNMTKSDSKSDVPSLDESKTCSNRSPCHGRSRSRKS